MASKNDPTEWMIRNPRGYLSHYYNITDHFRSSLTTAGNIYSTLEALMVAQEGLPQLEHQLIKLRTSINFNVGDVIELAHVDIIRSMAEVMEKICAKREKIKKLSATLIQERQTLVRLNSYLENYYTEERQPENGSGE